MASRYRHAGIAVAPVLALTLVACHNDHLATRSPTAPQLATPTLQDDPSHPGLTKGWLDTKLYFGLGPADQPEKGISETEWRAFLDKEVSPRFPAGFSVLDVYGQWQSKGEPGPSRLRSKMLIVDYQDSAENRAKVDAIRSAWKQKTGDQSVLRITEPADVSF